MPIHLLTRLMITGGLLIGLSGCMDDSYEEIQFNALPRGLQDCQFFLLKHGPGSTMSVVRCPNSSTTAETTTGNHHQQAAVIEERASRQSAALDTGFEMRCTSEGDAYTCVPIRKRAAGAALLPDKS